MEYKDFDRAIADYSRAIALDPNNAVCYCKRGLAYTAYGIVSSSIEYYDCAIADYNKAIELDPNYTDAYTWRDETYKMKSR